MAETPDGNEIIENTHSYSEASVSSPGDLVIDSNTEQFGDDVITASSQIPIIVDFWAPWCEPCKQMTPILEKLVYEYKGQVKLVKINIDENQALAQQLRVQSIPMVYAFKDGRPADAFNGALPESQLKQFIEKLTGGSGSPVDQAIEHANNLFEEGDISTANSIFNQVLEADSLNVDAHAGMVRGLMAAGDSEKARSYLMGLSPELLKNQKLTAVQTALELAAQTTGVGEVDELKNAVDKDPGNHQSRFDYALALYGADDTELAIEQLVEIIKRNKDWNDDAARQQLFKIFEALGHADPITIAGRRKMSVVLFS